MKNTFVSAVLLAAIGGGASLCIGGDDPMKVKLPAGIAAKELNDQEDQRSVMAAAASGALTKGGFDDMVERLSTPDRKRIGDVAEREFAEIDGRIEQIAKAWKLKYNQDFNINSQKLFDGFVIIHEAEVVDPAMAKASWPVPACADQKLAADTNGADSINALDKGRNVAIVTVPKGHGLPAVHLSMIHESVDDWRIDVPDNITGQQLADSVKNTVTLIGDQQANWPNDVNEAYRFVGHALFLSFYNVPVELNKAKMPGDR